MRISRSLQLSQSGGLVHKIWRAHNKDFLIKDDQTKYIYLDCVKRGLQHKSVNGNVGLSAYCIMDNHCHQLVSYQGESKNLSKFMRVSHSLFGQLFNLMNKRQGPVAYDRAKTPVIEPGNISAEMRVHFYIEANPLRAKIVKNLKYYRFSSFRFYAWGIKDKFSKLLKIPQWYLDLGKTPRQRQSKYRKLFYRYLKEVPEKVKAYSSARFIGSETWVLAQEETFKELIKAKAAGYS